PSISSAPIRRPMRGPRRNRAAARAASTPRTRRSSSTPRPSRPRAPWTGSRRSRATTAPTSTACRATKARCACASPRGPCPRAIPSAPRRWCRCAPDSSSPGAWNRLAGSDFRRPSGAIFAPLAPRLARLPADRWPTHGELTALAEGIQTSRGKPLRFVAPREPTDRDRRYYELHIADTGEVETRAENWHDLFNALAWLSFPRAKAAINAQHAAILEARGDAEARHRGSERDALTLFDEGGVVVATCAPVLLALIRG